MAKKKPLSKKELIAQVKSLAPENVYEMVDAPTSYLTTGWLPLDYGLGGGISIPKVTIVSGKWSSGKTTLALLACANCQKRGGYVIYGNSEKAPVINRAKQLGVDVDEWILFAPKVLDTYYDHATKKTKQYEVRGFFDIAGEQMQAIHEADPGAEILVVLDSVTSTAPSRFRQGKGGRGEHARVMGGLLWGFNSRLDENNAGLILINHLTTKQDSPGKATTFLAEAQQSGPAVCCVELEAMMALKEPKGQLTRATITKNKLTGVETYSLKLPIYLRAGVPYEEGCLEFLASVSERKGFIKYKGKWVGREKARDLLTSKRFRKGVTSLAEKVLVKRSADLRAGKVTLKEGDDDGKDS